MFTRRLRWWALGAALILVLVLAVMMVSLLVRAWPDSITQANCNRIRDGRLTETEVQAILGRPADFGASYKVDDVKEIFKVWRGTHGNIVTISFDGRIYFARFEDKCGPSLLEQFRKWLGW